MHRDAHDAYQATAHRCHACAEKERAARAFGDGATADRSGLYFPVERVTDLAGGSADRG